MRDYRRPVLAWLGALFVTTFSAGFFALFDAMDWSASRIAHDLIRPEFWMALVLPLFVVGTGIAPWAGLSASLGVWLARLIGMPRPFPDVTFWAVAMVLVTHHQMSSYDDYTVPALLSGMCGGLSYWFFAGRPQPPYAA